MMIFFYRSHPLDTTNPTAYEIEGWSVAAATSESTTAMNVLTGADVPVILPPPIAKFRMMKKLCQAMKNHAQARDANTCPASR